MVEVHGNVDPTRAPRGFHSDCFRSQWIVQIMIHTDHLERTDHKIVPIELKDTYIGIVGGRKVEIVRRLIDGKRKRFAK